VNPCFPLLPLGGKIALGTNRVNVTKKEDGSPSYSS
jgi:hypothetical protein